MFQQQSPQYHQQAFLRIRLNYELSNPNGWFGGTWLRVEQLTISQRHCQKICHQHRRIRREEKTGIDFFCNMPDKLEEIVEATYNLTAWGAKELIWILGTTRLRPRENQGLSSRGPFGGYLRYKQTGTDVILYIVFDRLQILLCNFLYFLTKLLGLKGPNYLSVLCR